MAAADAVAAAAQALLTAGLLNNAGYVDGDELEAARVAVEAATPALLRLHWERFAAVAPDVARDELAAVIDREAKVKDRGWRGRILAAADVYAARARAHGLPPPQPDASLLPVDGEPLTHFFHCWRFPAHQRCAVALIERQAEENDRLLVRAAQVARGVRDALESRPDLVADYLARHGPPAAVTQRPDADLTGGNPQCLPP